MNLRGALHILALLAVAGCRSARPSDLVKLEAKGLPPDASHVLIIARVPGGVVQVQEYWPDGFGYSASVRSYGFSADLTDRTGLTLKWIKSRLYGVLLRNKRRQWRVWWVEASTLAYPDSDERKIVLHLDRASSTLPISEDSLRLVGLKFGLQSPEWEPTEPGALLNSTPGRLSRESLDRKRQRWTGQLSEAENHAVNGQLSQAAEICAELVDELDVLVHAFPKWTPIEGWWLEKTYSSYAELDRAASAGDAQQVRDAIRSLGEALGHL